jgi:hypothetical protein
MSSNLCDRSDRRHDQEAPPLSQDLSSFNTTDSQTKPNATASAKYKLTGPFEAADSMVTFLSAGLS